MDLSGIPVIDGHCHFFAVKDVPADLFRTLTPSLNPVAAQDIRNTLAYGAMIGQLRSFLGVRGPEEEVLAERERRIKDDYRQYVTDLLEDALIESLVVDVGYKPAGVDGPAFEELVPVPVRYVYRIETEVDRLCQEGLPFPEAEERFFQALEEALSWPKLAALKSIIAYRTGLKIQKVNRASLVKGAAGEKEIRDYFFLKAVEKSIEMALPMQIHTGFGSSTIDLSLANPALLKGFLDDPAFRDARLVLLHGGYPYSFEAGYLANVYSHVYLDLSEINLFIPSGFSGALRSVFEMCPFNKAMYGSDGFIVPESCWLGARTGRKGLADLLGEFITNGLLDQDRAVEIAGWILSGTARKFYRLDG